MVASTYSEAARAALAIYEGALGAIRGDGIVLRNVRIEGDRLTIGSSHWDLARFGRIFVCGAGKASPSMAKGIASLLGNRLDGGFVATKAGHSLDIDGVAMQEAGHPIPDERSLLAGERMLQFAAGTVDTDLVFFALSGGASALLELPAGGLSLEDLQAANRALLACGAPIEDVNAVRSVLSLTKAGGLARAFYPATVLCLVLSDVMGNDLSVIGSGPFQPSAKRSPRDVVERYGLSDALGPSVMKAVSDAMVRHDVPEVFHAILADSSTAIGAAASVAEERGFRVRTGVMEGDLRQFAASVRPPGSSQQPEATIYGGETTTVVRGTGTGGRCQEMAVVMADRIAGSEGLAFLAGSTDGTDGPTDVSGGLVDHGSPERASERGWTVDRALSRSDSHAYLEACDGLVRTGPTGSNLNDLALFVRL